jgi:hypothetical protein
LTGRFRIGRERAEWPEGFEGGQGQASAETAKEMAPAQAGETLRGNVLVKLKFCFHGCSLAWTPFAEDCAGLASVTLDTFRRFWKGAESTIPINSAEKRPFSCSKRATIRSTVSTS